MRISRVVEVFEVWPESMPIVKFAIKILERDGSFLGIANIAIKNQETGEPEWTSGSGSNVDETLKDTIDYFFLEIQTQAYERDLTEDDFCWATPGDF
jgi:hypothetical protein